MKIPTPSHSISQGQNLDSIKPLNDEKSDTTSQIESNKEEESKIESKQNEESDSIKTENSEKNMANDNVSERNENN